MKRIHTLLNISLLLAISATMMAEKTVFAPIRSAGDLKPAAGQCEVIFVQEYNATTWYAPYLYSTNTYTRNANVHSSTFFNADYTRMEVDMDAYASYVWTIYGVSTQIQNYANNTQWWGGGSSTDSYLYNYNRTSYPGYIRTYRLPTSPDGGPIEATFAGDYNTNVNYKYPYYYSTSYTYMGPLSSAGTYKIYRKAYTMTFDDKDIHRYAAVNTETQYVFDTLELPSVTIASADYAPYITVQGWYDSNNQLVGQPGEKVIISEAKNLHLKYTKTGSSDAWVAFDLGDDLSRYATLIKDTLYSLSGSITLPNITLNDARYGTHISFTGWANENNILVGAPGQSLPVNSNQTLHAVFTRQPFTVTLDPGFYGSCGEKNREEDIQITLPAIQWEKAEYANRLTFRGWFDQNETLVGQAGETIMLYEDMQLHALYEAKNDPKQTWFMRTMNKRDLMSQDTMEVVFVNTYSSSTYYAARSYNQTETSNTSANYVKPTNNLYPTNGSSSTTTWVSQTNGKDAFTLDLTPTTNTSYDNRHFVWKITGCDSTRVRGYNGYWGNQSSAMYNSYPYLYTVNTTSSYKDYIARFNFVPDSAQSKSLVEWADWTSSNYRYFNDGNSSSYYTAGNSSASYRHWNIYRKAHRIGLDVNAELSEYGTCPTEVFVFDTLALPTFAFFKPDYANHVTILGWADENGHIIGQEGDSIVCSRNMELQLLYSVQKFTVTFDAGDHGNVETTSVETLLPITLPEIEVENGYNFEGWASSLTDRIVGQPGDTYPAGVNTFTADDNLYAVYTVSYEVIDWGKNSVTVEFLYAATSAETRTTHGTTLSSALTDCEIDKGIYCLPVANGDLSADEGQQLTITFKDAQGVAVSKATARIPVIISSAENIATEHDYGICASTDLVVVNGGVATAGTTPYTFKNIRVQAGGKLVIPAGCSLEAEKVYLRAGEIENKQYQHRYPQMVVNGSLINHEGKVLYDFLMNEEQYYNVALPYSVNISDITYYNGAALPLNTNLWVATYNGATRATGASGWEDVNGGALAAGKGYTIAATPRAVRITGGANAQRKYALVRFPLQADLTSGEGTSDKTVGVHAYPAQTGKDNDAGWNLVGNPFLANYGGAVNGLTANGIGLLIADGMGGYDWEGKVRYVVMPSDDGTAYYPVVASNASLPAFKNFFIQIGSGDALNFSFANRAQRIVAAQETENEEQDVMAGIVLARGEMSDPVGIVIGEQYTAAYEINADLQKWTNPNGLNFYALSGSDQLSFYAIPEVMAQNIRLGYTLPAFGTYTIRWDAQYSADGLDGVYLTDTKKNVTTDLLQKNYTFSVGAAEVNNGRFTLSIVRSPKVATGVNENVNVNENVKILRNGVLLIRKGGSLFTVTGIEVK